MPCDRKPALIQTFKVMTQSTQLGTDLQTACTHCGSVFRVTPEQLDLARGQVRCNQCMQVFNALTFLDNFDPNAQPLTPDSLPDSHPEGQADLPTTLSEAEQETLSLNEAMYGSQSHGRQRQSIKPLLWVVGVLILVILSIVQLIYYQRYQLIASANYQTQILNLCQILPCDESRFSSPSQIRMLERNVFSHPTRDGALMVIGSFVNDAPFVQSMPKLLISLSDRNGNLIANRMFEAREYLTKHTRARLQPGKAVQFKLEIVDPGTEALTYEFEFIQGSLS